MITLDEFEMRLSRAGRVHGPELLFDAWYGREIDRDTLVATIGPVWGAAEYPETMGRQAWLSLFADAGYTVTDTEGLGRPAARPAEATRLYRGSPGRLRRRMSWTADPAMAGKFAAGRLRGRPSGKVWAALVPPEAILARIDDRNESEYVIDTRGLRIVAAELVEST